MSNKFNEYGSGGDGGDATNGSLDIWGYSLRATNMDNNSSIKTNSIGQLISSKLNISDVNNLQNELDLTIQNPNNSVLVTDGLTVTTGNILKTDEIHESTLGANIGLANDLFTNNIIVTGGNEIKTNNIGEASLAGGMNILSNVDMSAKEIQNCELIKVDSIQSKNLTDDVVCGSNLDMFVKDIKNVNDITAVNVLCDNIKEKTIAGGINILNNVDMNLKTLNNVSNLETSTMTAQGVSTQILAPNPIFDATKVLVSGNLDMSSNNITNVNDTQTQSISTSAGTLLIKPTGGQALFQKPGGGTIEFGLEDGGSQFNFKKNGATNELCSEGTDIIQFTTDCFGAVKIASLNPTTDAFQLRDYNLDMNNNDLIDVGSMTITSTQYISKISDLPTPVGDFYVIPDNTTWIILGQITLQYGIQYGVNCSLRGIDFSAQITFDESVRDCVIKAVDNNFYLSQITIVNGGGRFSLSGRGLLDATNYNLGAPAPFYGRNKRFKVTDVNILRAYKIGTVEGFGTLNVTNNFFNGGGGLAGQASTYYTNEGLAVSDGLSLEFNNNKMVLMLGAQQASTLKLLNMKARVSPLLGFNAVTITGNIFHPRSTETGIDFDADSRTQLGNISGNVFIRTGGSEPLINYTDVKLYDNYNPLSIENYSINANTGVVDSEPNLKSAIGNSNSVTDINPASSEISPTFNDQVLQIKSSSRFAVQVNMSGGTQAFVANERMSEIGRNFLIIAVEPAVGVSPNITQTVYVTDMSATPQQVPNPVGGWTSPSGGSFTTATFTFRYRYSEKDPRKLVTVGTFTISTGNNETYFVAPGNGTPDLECEVQGTATNLGAGATVSISCTRLFNEGDILTFYLSSATGSATSITKGIINVK